MTARNRGLSTPIDVAIGILLVGVAVSVIAGIQPAAPDTPEGGSVLLGTTMEVTYENPDGRAVVSGSMGGLLGEAVLAGVGTPTPREQAFRIAVRETVSKRLSTLGPPIQVVGFCRGDHSGGASITVGESVPPDTPIRATVYALPPVDDSPSTPSDGSTSAPTQGETTHTDTTGCQPALVVRRWST